MLFANAQESGVWGVNTNPNSVNLGTAGVNHSPSGLNLGVNGENSSQDSLNSSPSSINSSASGEGLGLMALNSSQNALDLGNIAADSGTNAKSLGIIAVNSNESGENLGGGNSAPSSSASSENIVSYELEAVDISAKAEYEEYSSGQAVSRQDIENTSSGNGDISSVLRTLPNVVTPNNSRSSNMPGEIDAANISISGGLPYQNSYQLDGFEINNDIDPAGLNDMGMTPVRPRSGRSLGLNVDSSLLDSVVVLDSNIGAQYGRFGGGVVQANVRKPRKDGWHGNFSAQLTNSMITKQRLYESPFYQLNSSNENYQPNFYKYIFRASVDGYFTDTLGMLASFSTTRVTIPLQLYNSGTSQEKRDQKRVSDNFYVKLFWTPSDDFNLEYNFAYMPQRNTYFWQNRKNSAYSQDSGGIQTGLKALWNTDLGLWTNQLNWNRLEHSRRSDTNVAIPVAGANGWPSAVEGQFGGIDQIQNDINFKSDFAFEPVSAWISTHTFRVGAELIYQHAMYDKFEPTYMYFYTLAVSNNTYYGNQGKFAIAKHSNQWNGQPDSFGNISANHQYFLPLLAIVEPNKFSLAGLTYAAYVEDDINFDLGGGGDINARLGVRLDGDDYLNKLKFAPRFSLQYVAPWKSEWESALTFGANRYYQRNLLTYRLYDKMRGYRSIYYRCGPNDAWTADTTTKDPALGSKGKSIKLGDVCAAANNIDAVNPQGRVMNKLGDVSFSSAIFGASNLLEDLDVPYDDELMGAFSQNLGGLFNATFKYINRQSKKQVMQEMIREGSRNVGYWGNNGWTKSHIFTLVLKNIVPIKTGSVEHFYQASLDYTNVKRNFITYSDDFDANDAITLDGKSVAWEDIRQIYKQPLTFKLNTAHIFNYGKIKVLWNNLFTARGSYERVIYTASNTYETLKFGGSFNWDMRLGLDTGGIYINLDVLNVLDSKKLMPIGAENGALLYYETINSQANILAYELGRQFWVQVGYKF